MTIVMKKRFSMNTKKAVSGNAAVPGDNGGEPPLECRVVKSIISANDAGKSLLELLTGRFSYHSFSEWRTIIDRGLITLNGEKAFPEAILTKGDILEYHVADIAEPEVDASYAVLYEDADILAVDKSGDLPCHPAGPFYRNTLWFILKKRYGEVFPVNRLDRETSGIVLWAKNSSAASLLAAQLASMRKRYVALVHGKFTKEIDASGFLERDNASIVRKKRCFVYNDSGSGQRAETLLRPVWWNEKYSLVEALPRTGRLHQIRATLCSLGFPLVGDKLGVGLGALAGDTHHAVPNNVVAPGYFPFGRFGKHGVNFFFVKKVRVGAPDFFNHVGENDTMHQLIAVDVFYFVRGAHH